MTPSRVVQPLLIAARDAFKDDETHLTTKELLSRIVKANPTADFVSEWSTLTGASMSFAASMSHVNVNACRFYNGKQVRGYAKSQFQYALGEEVQPELPSWIN